MTTQTEKLALSEILKADLNTDSIKAVDMVCFLISNGWKTNKEPSKTAMRDMYKKNRLLVAVKLDYDFLYVEYMERDLIKTTHEINNDVVCVSSDSTSFINLHNIKPVDFGAVKADIKALRAKCRENGVKFSCIKQSELDDLFSTYMLDFSEYTEKFYATKAFWSRIVRNGLYTGYTRETDCCPSGGIDKLLYRSGSISKVESIVRRIDEIKNDDLRNYTMIAI